jgi:hypothetical protein
MGLVIFTPVALFFEESFCKPFPSMFAADKNVLPCIFPPPLFDLLRAYAFFKEGFAFD